MYASICQTAGAGHFGLQIRKGGMDAGLDSPTCVGPPNSSEYYLHLKLLIRALCIISLHIP